MIISTPICDFAAAYESSGVVRLHMPGHKGVSRLGTEGRDLTEVDGADVLYDAQGIILKSEQIAQRLFDTGLTLYSTEGSSLCIRAMLYLICLHAKQQGHKAVIAAARNAHKVFMTAAALLDVDIRWLFPKESGSVVSCALDLADVERVLRDDRPAALYVTSPDYLGNVVDISALSALCRQYGALLAVDNAHGAYLRFLPESRHPIHLGADLCCDSAHKTLPVLTGGAYLHISYNAPELLRTHAQNALSLFASTSPSYLILQSLDAANRYLADGYHAKLAALSASLNAAKAQLAVYGYAVLGDEPLKLTLAPKAIGWRGDELAAHLQSLGMMVEFADPDFVVMMFTPENVSAIEALTRALCSLDKRPPISAKPPVLSMPIQRMTPREAVLSPQQRIPVAQAQGRILAAASVNCPPAVPIVVCGEVIDQSAIECFRYYGIEHVYVVKE